MTFGSSKYHKTFFISKLQNGWEQILVVLWIIQYIRAYDQIESFVFFLDIIDILRIPPQQGFNIRSVKYNQSTKTVLINGPGDTLFLARKKWYNGTSYMC